MPLSAAQGIHYFEIQITQISDGSWIGVTTADAPEASYVGAHGIAWGSAADGPHGLLQSAFPTCLVTPGWTHSYSEGETVGVVLDCDEHTLSFLVDSVALGQAATNLPTDCGPLHLAVSNNTVGAQYVLSKRPAVGLGRRPGAGVAGFHVTAGDP